MKRLLIMAGLAMPLSAHAAVTMEDTVSASNALNAELLNVVTNLRAQITADQREIKELQQKLDKGAKPTPAEPPK